MTKKNEGTVQSETVTLEYPITVDGVEVSTITMRRPTLRDEIAYADSKASVGKRMLNLLASLTGIAPDDLLNLDGSDSDRLFKKYAEMKGGEDTPNPLE